MTRLIAALIILSVTVAQAQQQRADSLMLSIYHLGTKYRLTPATFGEKIANQDLLGEMVRAYDTLLIPAPFGFNEAAGESLTGWKVQYDCNKISPNLRDKIVVMDLNSSCDPTFICLKLQRAGAKAAILIHPINNKDSIELKGGEYADSIKIPCFTVRRGLGSLMTTQLPALVGIKKPEVMPDDAMALKSNQPKAGTPTIESAKSDKVVLLEANKIAIEKDVEIESTQKTPNRFTLSPNPTQSIAYFTYNLKVALDLTIDLRSVNGQLIKYQTFKNTQFGTYEINTQDLPNGIYMVIVKQANEISLHKLVVSH